MKIRFTAAALAAATLCGAPAFAQTQFGDHITLSGFGTLGIVSSDNKNFDFVRDGAPQGAGKKASWEVDSKLGVQANFTATDWLSGTLQVLSEQRYEPGIKADFEWAFVKVKPMDRMNIRLGRIAPAMFMVSDSRNVGYANSLIRMPNEVYALSGLKLLTGGDISYAFDVMGTTLTVSALAGKSEFPNAFYNLKSKKTRGLNAQWETDFGTFRIGQVKTTNVVPNFPFPGNTLEDPYTFSGLGYAFDDGRVVVGAEYVERRSKYVPQGVNSDGWYVMGGYRFGALLPYVTVAGTKNPEGPGHLINGEQSSYAVGLRWDVVSNVALKVQYEAINPKNSAGVSFTPLPIGVPPPAREKTKVLSLAVDFVF